MQCDELATQFFSIQRSKMGLAQPKLRNFTDTQQPGHPV